MSFIGQILDTVVLATKSPKIPEKVTAYIFIGIFNMPLLEVFEKYVFSDWSTLVYVLVLLGVDVVLGAFKHWKDKTANSKAFFEKLMEKLILCLCLLVVTHVTYSHQVMNDMQGSAETIRYFGNSVVIGYLLTTISKNLKAISLGSINIQKLIDIFKK